ncbi:MAG: sugar phosphate isomerase/epimerase family protein [Hyphomonadaceae bacterium]|nr:sugar phosphate isomerase/epimerase family protein [Hyphomonadaceae bacterium]
MKRRVLWAANVRTKSLEDRLAAAQAGGFSHMSLFPIDWRTWRSGGSTASTMRAKIRDAGIRILAIDPFVQWSPGFAIPDGYEADYRSFIDFSEDDIFRTAEEAEAEAINCVEGLGAPHPVTALVDAFGAFADRAHARGLRVTFEFMPISSVPALKDGWAIVSGADRPNAGLCFDTWHYFRSGADDALLRTIPGDKVFEVQLADGLTALQAPTLTEDLLRYRRLPGEGEMDIRGVVSTLKSIGAWTSVGPEVFADAMDARDAVDAGRACGASLAQFA